MKNCYKVKSGNEEIQGKGKVAPITLSVSGKDNSNQFLSYI